MSKGKPTNPTSGSGATAPAEATTPCHTDPCSDPKLDRQDDALVACILELCKTDPDVVKGTANDLILRSRNPKSIQLQTYNGHRWETTQTVTSLGSAQGNKIWINRGEVCHETKNTIYHEVWHTKQPASMLARDKEIDAFTATEQWLIDRKIPGTAAFRTKLPNGTEVPNRTAIESYVDKAYGYSSSNLRIVGRENGDATVVLEDGTKRPAQRGDKFQYTPPQNLCERRIMPNRLKCP